MKTLPSTEDAASAAACKTKVQQMKIKISESKPIKQVREPISAGFLVIPQDKIWVYAYKWIY